MSSKSVVVPTFLSALQKSIRINSGLQYTRFIQIATLARSAESASNSSSSSSSSSDIFPRIRTVVFRQFFSDSYYTADGREDQSAVDSLLIHTDARCEFYKELQEQKRAEVCWYFPLSREQYRLSCHVELCSSAEEHATLSPCRGQFWAELGNFPRLTYSALQPGSVTTTDHKEGDLDAYEAQPADSNTPNANFALVRLVPHRCDYLRLAKPVDNSKPVHRESELKKSPQALRALHSLGDDGEWTVVKLNP